jgi:hypothetical protein
MRNRPDIFFGREFFDTQKNGAAAMRRGVCAGGGDDAVGDIW